MSDRRRPVADRLGEAEAFLRQFQSILIASCSSDAHPDASYAPFVRARDNCFYVYLSDLAAHTANLRHTHRASLLLIEDEGASPQIFARRRLTFECDALIIARDSERHHFVLDLMSRKFGELIDMIRALGDFHVFQLTPRAATYVTGFAKAFNFARGELEALAEVHDESS